jgi:antitoxin component YwqK of YwqJK toxin-antitoxin module
MDFLLSRILQPLVLFLVLGLTAGVHPAAAELLVKELRYPDGSLKERYSCTLDAQGHEVREGLDEEWHPGGAKKGQRTWKDGKIEGTVVYYHPNGRKSYETNYVAGKKNGFATVWYLNGQKQWQTTFRNGTANGHWREWYIDGRKKFEAIYSDGFLDGIATWWHENGRMWQERTYAAGAAVGGTVMEWDKGGRQTFPPPEPMAGTPEFRPEAPAVVLPSTAAKIESPR